MLSAESTAEEIGNARPALVLLPLGATEQHSAHLPIGTDTLEAEAVARGVAEALDALCLPGLPYSISHMHHGSPGSFWLRNETLRLVLRDLAAGVCAAGHRYFMILNGHGGNRLLPAVIQDLNIDFPGLLSFSHDIFNCLSASGIFPQATGLQHAEEYETSLIWHLRPDLVHSDKFVENRSTIAVEALLYDPLPKISKLTHTGNPAAASPEKGKLALDYMIKNAVEAARYVINSVEARRSDGK